MARMQYFKISPIGGLIAENIPPILAHHIHVADAIQILTCKHENCDLFATFDKKLKKVARAEGLKVM